MALRKFSREINNFEITNLLKPFKARKAQKARHEKLAVFSTNLNILEHE